MPKQYDVSAALGFDHERSSPTLELYCRGMRPVIYSFKNRVSMNSLSNQIASDLRIHKDEAAGIIELLSHSSENGYIVMGGEKWPEAVEQSLSIRELERMLFNHVDEMGETEIVACVAEWFLIDPVLSS